MNIEFILECFPNNVANILKNYLKNGWENNIEEIRIKNKAPIIILNSSETVGVEFDRALRFDEKTKKNRRTIPQSYFEGLNCSCKLDTWLSTLVIAILSALVKRTMQGNSFFII